MKMAGEEDRVQVIKSTVHIEPVLLICCCCILIVLFKGSKTLRAGVYSVGGFMSSTVIGLQLGMKALLQVYNITHICLCLINHCNNNP